MDLTNLYLFISRLDVFHHHGANSQLSKRVLYGRVFGNGQFCRHAGIRLTLSELPAYIIFHAMFGYVLLGIAFCALFLRLPMKIVRRRHWLHPYFGWIWIFGTAWMGVTAIWCVYDFIGWDIIAFFIFSMFA